GVPELCGRRTLGEHWLARVATYPRSRRHRLLSGADAARTRARRPLASRRRGSRVPLTRLPVFPGEDRFRAAHSCFGHDTPRGRRRGVTFGNRIDDVRSEAARFTVGLGLISQTRAVGNTGAVGGLELAPSGGA